MPDVVEEPVETPAVVDETPTQQDAPTPEPEPATSPAAPDLYTLLTKELGAETEDPLLDEAAKGITPDTIKNADPETRTLLRALLRADAQRKAEVEAQRAEVAKQAAEREAKIAAEAKRIAQQRQALVEMAAKVKPPGEAPQVDPLSPEGMRATAEHAARAATYDAWKPLIEERERIARENAWLAIVEKHPGLADEKVSAEFDDYFVNVLNKGRDLSKQGTVVPAEIAADLFFNQRELAAARERQARQTQTRDTERAAAARAVGRSAGAGGADKLASLQTLLKEGRVADAMRLAESDPRLRAAFIEATRAA